MNPFPTGSPPAPFDTVAGEYDETFTDTPLGRRQRQIVHRYLEGVIRPEFRVLELNCGTGQDAIWLADRVSRVLATDISESMIEVARRKAERAPNGGRISFKRLAIEDIAGPEGVGTEGEFDLVFSDFDGLNCLRELDWLPGALARLLKPGGEVILVFMNPVCPMEILYFLAQGRISRAFGRLRKEGLAAHIGDGVLVRTYFHPVGRVRRLFAPRFLLRAAMAIGLTTPPTPMRDFYHRHQGEFRHLFGLEDRLAPIPPFNRLGDHVLMHFQLAHRPDA